DVAGNVLGQDIDPGVAGGAGWEADGPAPNGEILAENTQRSTRRLETAVDRGRGAVSGYANLAAPFTVEAMAAQEGLAWHGHFDVKINGNGRIGLSPLPRLCQDARRRLRIPAVDLYHVEPGDTGRQPVGNPELAAGQHDAGIEPGRQQR